MAKPDDERLELLQGTLDMLILRTLQWGRQHGHDVVVVWEGAETADDVIARRVGELPPPLWVVTSDRELRERVADRVERIVGGGSFARQLP